MTCENSPTLIRALATIVKVGDTLVDAGFGTPDNNVVECAEKAVEAFRQASDLLDGKRRLVSVLRWRIAELNETVNLIRRGAQSLREQHGRAEAVFSADRFALMSAVGLADEFLDSDEQNESLMYEKALDKVRDLVKEQPQEAQAEKLFKVLRQTWDALEKAGVRASQRVTSPADGICVLSERLKAAEYERDSARKAPHEAAQAPDPKAMDDVKALRESSEMEKAFSRYMMRAIWGALEELGIPARLLKSVNINLENSLNPDEFGGVSKP